MKIKPTSYIQNKKKHRARDKRNKKSTLER